MNVWYPGSNDTFITQLLHLKLRQSLKKKASKDCKCQRNRGFCVRLHLLEMVKGPYPWILNNMVVWINSGQGYTNKHGSMRKEVLSHFSLILYPKMFVTCLSNPNEKLFWKFLPYSVSLPISLSDTSFYILSILYPSWHAPHSWKYVCVCVFAHVHVNSWSSLAAYNWIPMVASMFALLKCVFWS